MKKLWLISGILIVIASLLLWQWLRHRQSVSSVGNIPTNSAPSPEVPPPASTDTMEPSVVIPIADFKARITKKFFGTYVTPTNSPVMPERFKGYHTGVDVEYGDITADVPVVAIADGTVEVSKWASGYGGVLLIRHQVNNRTFHVVYGHLRPASMVAAGVAVKKGEQIAVLGTAYSSDTDGERRHLHFGVALSPTITGYVSSQTKLNEGWIDPLTLY